MDSPPWRRHAGPRRNSHSLRLPAPVRQHTPAPDGSQDRSRLRRRCAIGCVRPGMASGPFFGLENAVPRKVTRASDGSDTMRLSHDLACGDRDMPVHGNATSGVCAAALALVLAACGGGGGGGGVPPGEVTAAQARAEAVAAAIEAAKAAGEDGGFDDTAYGVAPSVTAVDDGTTVTIGVTESGTPRGGSARSGDFAEREDAPAAIAGWTGVRFQRATAKEFPRRLFRCRGAEGDGLHPGQPQQAGRGERTGRRHGAGVRTGHPGRLAPGIAVDLARGGPGGQHGHLFGGNGSGSGPGVRGHVRGRVGHVPLLRRRLLGEARRQGRAGGDGRDLGLPARQRGDGADPPTTSICTSAGG